MTAGWLARLVSTPIALFGVGKRMGKRMSNYSKMGAAAGFAADSRRKYGDQGLVERAKLVPPMVVASLKGETTAVSRSQLGLMVLGLLYILSPIDLVPEALFLMFGLADDVLIGSWIAATLLSATERFEREPRERENASSASVHPEPMVIRGETIPVR